jgi:hypothetical protein
MATDDGTALAPPVEPVLLEVEEEAPLARLEACCGLQGRALGARIDLSGLLAAPVSPEAAGWGSETMVSARSEYLLPRRTA